MTKFYMHPKYGTVRINDDNTITVFNKKGKQTDHRKLESDLESFIIKNGYILYEQSKLNPRLKGHHKVYIVRTISGIPLGAYGGQRLAHKHAQNWADKTGEQIAMEPMGVLKK